MGSLKSPCATSYRSSVDTNSKLLVFWENIVFCILATDRQTGRTDPLSRSRCRERGLNNIVTLKSGLEVTRGSHWKWYHWKAWKLDTVSYSHSTVTWPYHYFIIFNIKRDVGRKITILFTHTLHSTPPLWGSPSEYYLNVWCGNRMVWRPSGEKVWWHV